MQIKELVRLCVDHADQWHQHFLTKVDMLGRVMLGLLDDTLGSRSYDWDRYPVLDDYQLPIRSEWFALRPERDDGMDLYRLDQGSQELVQVLPPDPLYSIFKECFIDGGGMTLRDSEIKQQEAEAADYEQARRDAIASR